MPMLKFVELVFLTWALYSCIGWIWETGLSIVVRRRFVDRGVLIGPLCPIYGFGALLVLVCAIGIRKGIVGMAISSAVLSGIMALILC